MRAWHLTDSPGQYRWGEVPTPEPGPGEVRLRVRASALNHMDLWLTKGMPRPPSFPHVPGNDVAGVVESVGEGVTGWAPGDEVVVNTAIVPAEALERGQDSVLDPTMRILGEHCWGGHGEYCVVPAHQLERRPTSRTWAESVAYPVCATTAWRLLRRARVQAGDTVLVTGIGGGVATFALLIAKQMGARVFATSRDEEKRKRAVELGAEDAFDSEGPYPVRADVVVDSIGPATWDHSIRSLRHGGRMCVCGGTTGPKVELDLPRLFFKQLEVIGASCGSQEEFRHVTGLMEEGLPVVIDGVLPLSEYPSALERLRSGTQVGKIVLEHPAHP
ncbi:MAG TPA: zinc-binding dehydrogenase [Microthrixaceae bacterium]|nr:zinc-binding dehydrogenase [Microthrixaceae bacterium]